MKFCISMLSDLLETQIRGLLNMTLKGIPHFMDADLLWVLAAMGHGDELAVVDRNFSAHRVACDTTSGKLIVLNGMNVTDAIAGIIKLFPLDSFVDQPLSHMEAADQPGKLLPVHSDVESICSAAAARKLVSNPIERFAYYPLAKSCFAVIQTSEDRPYANFILKKGVVW
jgi:L-fucose mutarotase